MFFLKFLGFFLFAIVLHRSVLSIAEGIVDYVIRGFTLMVACIIPTGFLLSFLRSIDLPAGWLIVTNVLAGLILLTTSHRSLNAFPIRRFSWMKWFLSLPKIQKITFGLLALGVFVTAVANLVIIFFSYPSEWDSMTGHLVKCAYYLQNGSYDRLNGTTWTIDFYPNSLPSLQIYFYHLFGNEMGFKVIHYMAYWVFGVAMFGITRQLTENFSAAVFVGLISLLLPTALVQATTTETDLLLTTYLAVATYFLIRFNRTVHHRNAVIFIALSMAIWMSHKVTFILMLPAVFVVAMHFVLFKKTFWAQWKILLPSAILFLLIYVWPTGYVGNVQETGKLSGISAPDEVMRWHGNVNYSTKQVLEFGSVNVARYLMDFFNLDGIRNFAWGEKLNDWMRFIPSKISNKLRLERDQYWVVSPYKFKPIINFYAERPFWGVTSFLLILPAILLIFFHKSKKDKTLAVLFFAGILHFLSLSYTAPYDPIKGRYFMNTVVWFFPLMIVFFTDKKWSKYLLFVTVLVVIQAFGTTFKRRLYPLFSTKNQPSIFKMSRLEQQVKVYRPDIYEAYAKFDSLVPQNAVVALATTNEDFEYPLWGKNLTRTLIPIHPFKSDVKLVPVKAEYVLITKGVMPIEKTDIHLNPKDFDIATVNPVEANQYYLRKTGPIASDRGTRKRR